MSEDFESRRARFKINYLNRLGVDYTPIFFISLSVPEFDGGYYYKTASSEFVGPVYSFKEIRALYWKSIGYDGSQLLDFQI